MEEFIFRRRGGGEIDTSREDLRLTTLGKVVMIAKNLLQAGRDIEATVRWGGLGSVYKSGLVTGSRVRKRC